MDMAWTKNLPTALLKKDFILMLPLRLHSNTEAVNEEKQKNAPVNQQANVAELVRLSFKAWWVSFCFVLF